MHLARKPFSAVDRERDFCMMVAHHRSVSVPIADLPESAITRNEGVSGGRCEPPLWFRDRQNKAKLASVHAIETTGI
jgi:hypothetical protein